jgi:pyruvate dehydrogenase E1 component beta subunit
MSGGQYNIPIVFRGPNGAALQLSAQHSQAFESWLAYIPGIKVVTPGTPYDAKGLLKSAIRDDNPVCFLEGEMLYNTKGEVPEEEYLIPLGKADLKREGDHCSIITNGKMALLAMQAADQLAKDGITVDVVDLRTVRPMDVDAIKTSVEKTNRAVVLEEGWEICGIGTQVVDYIQRECFTTSTHPWSESTKRTSRCRTRRTSSAPRNRTFRRRSLRYAKSCISTKREGKGFKV